MAPHPDVILEAVRERAHVARGHVRREHARAHEPLVQDRGPQVGRGRARVFLKEAVVPADERLAAVHVIAVACGGAQFVQKPGRMGRRKAVSRGDHWGERREEAIERKSGEWKEVFGGTQ